MQLKPLENLRNFSYATWQNPYVLQGSIALVVAFGIANRVLYKMALNPLSDYVFFLAQFQTFSYVALYFAVLGYKRYVSVPPRPSPSWVWINLYYHLLRREGVLWPYKGLDWSRAILLLLVGLSTMYHYYCQFFKLQTEALSSWHTSAFSNSLLIDVGVFSEFTSWNLVLRSLYVCCCKAMFTHVG